MERCFSLAHLTVLDLSPPDLIEVAARVGYQTVGVRLIPATPRGPGYLLGDPAQQRATKAAIAATGVNVFDVEIIRLTPECQIDDFREFLEVAADIGAKAILVAGNDPDEARLTDRFAAFCAAAAPYGLTGDLEPMPWTNVPNLATAIRIVSAANQPNGGILVDTLHFDRSDSTLAQLTSIPRSWLHYAQLCDAPAEKPTTVEGLIHTARAERLFPGEGGIDLLPIMAGLPTDLPISLEIPTETLACTLGPEARARRALDAARSLLARL